MVKLVVLYRRPPDPEAFDRHYFQVHVPLAAKLPGVKRIEIAKVTGSPMGEAEHYLMAQLYFADEQALQAALASPEGQATGKDVRGFAKGLVSIQVAQIQG